MSGRNRSRVAGGERAAYEKFTEGMRHCIEAATELGLLQSDDGWTTVARLCEQMLEKTKSHALTRAANRMRFDG